MFATLGALMLTIYWIFSNNILHSASGMKPRCEGSPHEVGFPRDIIVDLIARNMYNKLFTCPISDHCKKLANIRTSTCFIKCKKWKKSSAQHVKVTTQIFDEAEKLLENFNLIVSKESALANRNDEKFIFERINEAKCRLIDAGVTNPNLIEKLEELKKNFCTCYHLEEQQMVYQKIVGKNDDETMIALRNLIFNEDFITAVEVFIQFFESDGSRLIKYHVENDVIKEGGDTRSGIARLRFEYRKKMDIKENAVILKIPSLVTLPSEELEKTDIFDREVYFYKTLLPALYELANCEPFAPKLYAATTATALVLEDLSTSGYTPGDRILQLDMDHIGIALEFLAKYHALGHMYLRNPSRFNPDMSLLGSFQPTPRSEPRKDDFHRFCQMIKPLISPPLYNAIVKLEYKILADPMTKGFPSEVGFTVIAHADFRADNILFNYNDKGLVHKAKVIDWQLGREASPILDLMYFLVTSVPIEIVQRQINPLLNSYFEKLNNQLSSLGALLYDRVQFIADLKYHRHYFLNVLSISWQQIMRAGPPGQNTDTYVARARKWLYFLELTGGIYDS